ncbi:PREDICTED: LOW QUALITY PROTEIN: probable cation-transporting ATPase 13A3, partial [Priapulus caudatus]|uniref:Cation-transporting ATPase n=1 Tax=Priapulus caudatus TaxID=37621 RepID=A0ABM1DRX7_PRICU
MVRGAEKVRFPTGGPPPTKSGMEYVNIGLEDQMEIRGYTPTTWKTTVTWICIVLTAGLLRVVFHWKPEWMLSCTHSRSSLATAVKLLLKDQYEQWFVEKVNVHRAEEVRRAIYGDNEIAVEVQSILKLLFLETQNNQSPGVIAIRALDLITITVPPVLPAAMTIGIIYAQRRLKLANIYCISPRTINLCGSINVVCFDKTGTLTEDGIDMHGVVPTENNVFQDVEPDVQQLPQCPTLWAIASCHSLSLIDGQLKGDPLDMKLFFSTEWEFIEPGPKVQGHQIPTLVRSQTSTAASAGSEHEESIVELGVLRQYVFVSSLQRMSVVAYNFRNDMFECYVKGSPEKLVTLSRPETVPADFQEVLREYAPQQGYRMLALAYKRMPDMQWDKVKNIHREDVECDLEFLGLVALENRLKPQTTPVISQLRQANIRTVMITGDNTLTALSVARHCGMILKSQKAIMVSVDATQLVPGTKAPLLRYKYVNFKDPDEHEGSELDTVASENDSTAVHVQLQDENEAYRFAVDGKTFDVIRYSYPDLLPRILVRGTVFSRMSPDQKAVVVEVLQKLGYFVGMCGDGANDCG